MVVGPPSARRVSGSGDTRKRNVAWRDRIIDENLINILVQQQLAEQQSAEQCVPEKLLVPESWWRKHAPGIAELWTYGTMRRSSPKTASTPRAQFMRVWVSRLCVG